MKKKTKKSQNVTYLVTNNNDPWVTFGTKTEMTEFLEDVCSETEQLTKWSVFEIKGKPKQLTLKGENCKFQVTIK